MENKLYFLSFLCLLVFINAEQAINNSFIEMKINIDKDRDPTVSVRIGNKEDLKLSISLISSIIETFQLDDGTNDYYTPYNSKTYENLNKTVLWPDDDENEFHLSFDDLGKDIIVLNESMGNENTFVFGNALNITYINHQFAGVLGLGNKEMINLETDQIFLNQLKGKNLISSKSIYISNYYKDNSLLSESKLIIGDYQKELEKKKLTIEEFSFCHIEKDINEFSYYICTINGLLIQNNTNQNMSIEVDSETLIFNNDYIYFNDLAGKYLIFEEKGFEKILLPAIYFLKLGEKAKDRGCNYTLGDDKIFCNEEVKQNLSISLIINNYKYKLCTNSLFNGTELKIGISPSDMIIAHNSFLGNFIRIYDVDNNKIYFHMPKDDIDNDDSNQSDYTSDLDSDDGIDDSDKINEEENEEEDEKKEDEEENEEDEKEEDEEENEEEKEKEKDNDNNHSTAIVLAVVGGVLFIVIIVAIIFFVTRNVKDNLKEKVNAISFQEDNKNEDEEGKDTLL